MSRRQDRPKCSPARPGAGRPPARQPGRAKILVVAAVGALLLEAVALLALGGDESSGTATGSADPTAFDLPALDGDGRVRLADLSGGPVVVNFFASWCTACDFELPHFAAVSDELRDEVTFVGVNALETDDRFLMPKRHGIEWWPLAGDIGPRGDLHAALGGRGMPITAYYGPDGGLVHVDRSAPAGGRRRGGRAPEAAQHRERAAPQRGAQPGRAPDHRRFVRAGRRGRRR